MSGDHEFMEAWSRSLELAATIHGKVNALDGHAQTAVAKAKQMLDFSCKPLQQEFQKQTTDVRQDVGHIAEHINEICTLTRSIESLATSLRVAKMRYDGQSRQMQFAAGLETRMADEVVARQQQKQEALRQRWTATQDEAAPAAAAPQVPAAPAPAQEDNTAAANTAEETVAGERRNDGAGPVDEGEAQRNSTSEVAQASTTQPADTDSSSTAAADKDEPVAEASPAVDPPPTATDVEAVPSPTTAPSPPSDGVEGAQTAAPEAASEVGEGDVPSKDGSAPEAIASEGEPAEVAEEAEAEAEPTTTTATETADATEEAPEEEPPEEATKEEVPAKSGGGGGGGGKKGKKKKKGGN